MWDETWVIDEWREGISELNFVTGIVIRDFERLYDLYDLFAELLNHLCHIGSAYEDDPLLNTNNENVMAKLLNIFRPQKRIIWQKLCEEIGADFIPAKAFKHHDMIHAYHKNWTIIIDTYKIPKGPMITRIKAHMSIGTVFILRYTGPNIFSGLFSKVGLEDIVIGHRQFDKDFVIQGNDERKLKELFDNNYIRRLISWQPSIHLKSNVDNNWVIDDWREGISELHFQVVGVIKDYDRLYDLYDLFAELLNHLCHIGSAYEDDPLL